MGIRIWSEKLLEDLIDVSERAWPYRWEHAFLELKIWTRASLSPLRVVGRPLRWMYYRIGGNQSSLLRNWQEGSCFVCELCWVIRARIDERASNVSSGCCELLIFFCWELGGGWDTDIGCQRAIHTHLIQGPQKIIHILRLFQSPGPNRGMQRLRSETCSVFKRRLEHMPCPSKVNNSVHPEIWHSRS